MRIGIVYSKFNHEITYNLLEGAKYALRQGYPKIIQDLQKNTLKSGDIKWRHEMYPDIFFHQANKVAAAAKSKSQEKFSIDPLRELYLNKTLSPEQIRDQLEEIQMRIIEVPGAYELPLGAKWLTEGKYKCDGIIALGAIIKGETSHDEYIANACSQGLMQVSLGSGIPLGFGLITADDLEQARARSSMEALQSSANKKQAQQDNKNQQSNKGYEAAEALLAMLWERSIIKDEEKT